MQNRDKIMIEKVLSLGAFCAAVVDVCEVSLSEHFRTLCENNVCGAYGKCWMCPPDVGEIHDLMQKFRSFDRVLVYQSVATLEDSFDFEGMMEAAERHAKLMQDVREALKDEGFARVLYLGAGGCHFCETCAKRDNEPCRFPEKAMPSLESFGVDVSALAKLGGMKYINGKDTVTYFGAVCFSV